MSEHTPGPWIRNSEHSDLMAGVRVESEHEHGVVNDGWVICTCEGPDAEANGLVLAAAMDLLAACEDVLCCQDHKTWISKLGPIRAAVAKARGRKV